MALLPGSHGLDSQCGTVVVQTYREGVGQKIGHDLIIDVGQWEATIEVGSEGTPSALALEADGSSLRVREGLRGAKALTDKDRGQIRKNIDEKVLGGKPITFRSATVECSPGRMHVEGDLSMAGTTRPATFEVDLGDDGRLSGTCAVTQSDWGIKPYKAFMGALKVRDEVEIVLDVRLPSD